MWGVRTFDKRYGLSNVNKSLVIAFNIKSGNSFLIFKCCLVRFRHSKIENQSLACNVLVVLKELVGCCILLVITSLFIQSADARPSNISRTLGCQRKDSSWYNLKILLRGGSSPPIKHHPRMQRNGFHKIHRCRTLRWWALMLESIYKK